MAQRGLKNIHATLPAAGFGVPLKATFVWPQGRASCGLRPRHLGPKGAEKIHATLRAAGFGVPSGATVVWPQGRSGCGLRPRHLGPKGSKKHSCNPAGCGIWRALGGDSRLASRPSDLRTASAVPLAQRALKNIHAILRAVRFGAPSGATFVWPQNQAICGLRPR